MRGLHEPNERAREQSSNWRVLGRTPGLRYELSNDKVTVIFDRTPHLMTLTNQRMPESCQEVAIARRARERNCRFAVHLRYGKGRGRVGVRFRRILSDAHRKCFTLGSSVVKLLRCPRTRFRMWADMV